MRNPSIPEAVPASILKRLEDQARHKKMIELIDSANLKLDELEEWINSRNNARK